MLFPNNIIYYVTYTYQFSYNQFNYEFQIPQYYYNRNYYRTFDDHEFDQEDFFTSLKSIGATQKETKQSS